MVSFTLDGLSFLGINGGPQFTFNESVSFAIDCEDQAEVDRLWAALIEGGGEPGQCGWLKDRFGLSWQVVPSALPAMMSDPDGRKGDRVMKAFLQMRKFDLATLQRAYDGK